MADNLLTLLIAGGLLWYWHQAHAPGPAAGPAVQTPMDHDVPLVFAAPASAAEIPTAVNILYSAAPGPTAAAAVPSTNVGLPIYTGDGGGGGDLRVLPRLIPGPYLDANSEIEPTGWWSINGAYLL